MVLEKSVVYNIRNPRTCWIYYSMNHKKKERREQSTRWLGGGGGEA